MSMLLAGTCLVAVLLLSGVAFFNGYALLYPDSISYVVDSTAVVKALLFRELSDSRSRQRLAQVGCQLAPRNVGRQSMFRDPLEPSGPVAPAPSC